jgi:hypothetical protein
MTVAAGELASESVSLTTYYPAPSGVYAQMITTQNTYLARDGGGVAIGGAVPPAAGTKLAVTGGNVVMGGNVVIGGNAAVDRNVGIGTRSPSASLDVVGSLRFENGAQNGFVLTSDADGNATWQNAGQGHTQIVDSDPSTGPTVPIGCPSGFRLVSCQVETWSSDGQGFHPMQRLVYVDHDGMPTATDPVGCYSGSSDQYDVQVVHAYCVSR